MKVRELFSKLQYLDQDAEVFVMFGDCMIPAEWGKLTTLNPCDVGGPLGAGIYLESNY